MKTSTIHIRGTFVSLFGATLLLLASVTPGWGQCPAPAAGPLQCVANIPLPGWTTANGSPDVFAFNPATRIMYFADRVNRGATAIDTTTWNVIGTLSPPNCATIGGSCPSGVLIAPDLQKMVLTSRSSVLWIYNLLVPKAAPTTLTLPAGSGADELDYDPINHRVYMGNTTAPYFITVIDLITETILGQIPIPTSVEQPRFNPVDGWIYVNTPDDDSATHAGQAVIVIDPSLGPVGQIVRTYPVTNCAPHAIDLDPLTNVALLGCSQVPSPGFQLMNLATGAIVGTIPIDGNDLGRFNPNTRRWYFAAGHNTHGESNCPKDSTGAFPGVAVVSDFPTPNQFIGEACSARNSGMIGIDPLANNVYVANRQFPVDPNSSSTGQSGMLVYHDPAPSITGTPAGTLQAFSRATFAAVGSSGVTGTVEFSLRRRYMFVDGGLNGLAAGFRTTTLVITTTAGMEVIPCGIDGAGKGYCQGHLIGDPLIGGVVNVSAGVALVARGTINLVATIPAFISVDSVSNPDE